MQKFFCDQCEKETKELRLDNWIVIEENTLSFYSREAIAPDLHFCSKKCFEIYFNMRNELPWAKYTQGIE